MIGIVIKSAARIISRASRTRILGGLTERKYELMMESACDETEHDGENETGEPQCEIMQIEDKELECR